MIPEKTNISARVDLTLKKIVEESTFNHKDAYELGAKLIAIGDAEETMEIIDKLESRMFEMNKFFKEMNNVKNLFGI